MSCLDQHHHCHRQKKQPHSSLHQKPQSGVDPQWLSRWKPFGSTSFRRRSRYYRIDISQTAKQNRSTSISIDANRAKNAQTEATSDSIDSSQPVHCHICLAKNIRCGLVKPRRSFGAFYVWRIDLPARIFLEMRERLIELNPRQFIFEPNHFSWRKRRRIVKRRNCYVDRL